MEVRRGGAVPGSRRSQKEDGMEKQMNDATAPKLGPFLTLLLRLCRRRPRRRRAIRQELTLPRGCVLGVRYSSR